MKSAIFLRCFLIVWMMFFFLDGEAHPGGHYSDRDKQFLNSWTLRTGETVRGNFSRADHEFLYLENEKGVFSVPISALSDNDQKMVMFKISRLEKLNESHSLQPPIKKKLNQNLFLAGMVSLIFLLLLAPKKRVVLAAIAGSLFIYACSKAVGSPVNPVATSPIPKTRTTFLDSAFNDFKPSISTRYDDKYFYLISFNNSIASVLAFTTMVHKNFMNMLL